MNESAPIPWLPGGRYTCTAALGEGGMATVYRAYDHDLGEWIAIKVLHERYAKQKKARQRFLDEGRTMQVLSHRNLVQSSNVVDYEPPFFAMDLAEGGSLMDWINKNGPMPPRFAVDVVIQICKGIAAAHERQVVHRDIKPHNVLISRKGMCKVADFGIARIPSSDGVPDVPNASTTVSGRPVGTLGFMAPEQRTNPLMVDVRTDVYSIGATLNTLVTNRTVMDLFMAEREPDKLDGLPGPLRTIILKATHYKPEERYSTVAELSRVLFDAKELLEPDPPGTPSLIGSLPPEPPPPPPPPLAPPGPPVRVGPPSLTSEDARAVRSAHRVKDVALGQRLRASAPPAAERVEAPRPKSRRYVALVIVMATVLATSSVLVTGVSAAFVSRAEDHRHDAGEAYQRSLDHELPIIDDLRQLGTETTPIEGLYRSQRELHGAARFEASNVYVEALRTAVGVHTSKAGVDLVDARERLGRIEAAQSAYDDACQAWVEALDSPLAQPAVRLGMVAGP